MHKDMVRKSLILVENGAHVRRVHGSWAHFGTIVLNRDQLHDDKHTNMREFFGQRNIPCNIQVGREVLPNAK